MDLQHELIGNESTLCLLSTHTAPKSEGYQQKENGEEIEIPHGIMHVFGRAVEMKRPHIMHVYFPMFVIVCVSFVKLALCTSYQCAMDYAGDR